MDYIAIIPARAGSKGLPGKNIRPIAGRPLIAWSVEQALQTPRIRRTIVSTDSGDIAEVARNWGADVPFLRPPHLAMETTPTEPVMLHALEWAQSQGERFDAVVLLQPTSPLRLPGTLDAALDRFEAERADSLVGVCESHHFFWKDPASPKALYDFRNRPRRQDIPPSERQYRENGSIYVTRTEAFTAHRNRLCGKIAMHVMQEEEGWEIDSVVDFVVLEALLGRFLATKTNEA